MIGVQARHEIWMLLSSMSSAIIPIRNTIANADPRLACLVRFVLRHLAQSQEHTRPVIAVPSSSSTALSKRSQTMMMGDIQALDIQIPREIVQYWGWFLAFGIALLLLGIAAVVRSVTATVATMLFFGWLLIIASAIEIVQALMVGHWAGFFHHLLAAILFGVIGVMLVAKPLISAEALTVVMGVFFLIGGLFRLIASLAVALPGWGWEAVDGIITLVLGGLILAQWPASGLWVIGLFVGIDLIFYGLAWIALAAGLRTA
jgi:uncharacterized membrane protein HdeD (DUF308 family)